jgi:hypothetical protein
LITLLIEIQAFIDNTNGSLKLFRQVDELLFRHIGMDPSVIYTNKNNNIIAPLSLNLACRNLQEVTTN